jgi:hypothetical protein
MIKPTDEIIYVNEVRRVLNEINYCKNRVEFTNADPADCTLEHLCNDCEAKLYQLLQWSDLGEDDPTPNADNRPSA